LNPHLFEMANIREQDAWVHRASPDAATSKAKGLVRMAVAKAQRLAAIQRGTMPVQPSALVIGGGLAGMTAALSIAAQGCEVTLVEREPELGGNLQHIRIGTRAGDPQALLRDTIRRVIDEPRIAVYTSGRIEEVSGYVGQFRTRLRAAEGETVEVEHGAIVVATGARQMTPSTYGYGRLAGVLTQRELEAQLESVAAPAPADIIMIQCVGSREDAHPYCSRVCCTEAIKNALAIRRRSPSTRVTILYRDLRSYGFREELYRQARLAGVRFLPFEAAAPPEVRQGAGRLEVRVVSPPEPSPRTLPADLVVLSAGIEPEPGNADLSRLLKLPLNREGFFLEAHVKLRPVDFAAEGIFLCGMAHSPRSMDETIGQARAAAVRAVGLLTKKELTATPITASVDPRLCAACGVCVDVCPFGARRIDPEQGIADVVAVLCQGCGACVAACPNKASQQKGFDFQQVGAMLDAALMAEG
jgi:heterodisulfide reductase subunit A